MKPTSVIVLIFITLLLFILHLVPVIIIVGYKGASEWAILYAPLFALDCLWGSFIDDHWGKF